MKKIFYNLCLVLFGYFFGSVLFARLFGSIIAHKDITKNTNDRNPGAFNAFKNGGKLCGSLTLLLDMFKGFLPVFVYLNYSSLKNSFWTALIVVAPVLGHIFPAFNGFKGGKGIAVSFGVLLGFFPDLKPVLSLAAVFLVLTFVININPEYYKTMVTYPVTAIFLFFLTNNLGLVLGFAAIAFLIVFRLVLSREEKGSLEVKPIWKR